MIKKIVKYQIDENTAQTIIKVTGKISDTEFRGTYGLNDNEIDLIHQFFDSITPEDG